MVKVDSYKVKLFLFCNANDDVLADEVDNGLGGLVLLSLGVDVFKFQLDIRQEARAVVDPLDGVTQCAGYGSSLSEKIQNGKIILIREVYLKMILVNHSVKFFKKTHNIFPIRRLKIDFVLNVLKN